MTNNLSEIIPNLEKKLNLIKNLEDLESLRVEYLGKNGAINSLMQELAKLSNEEKKEFGSKVNIIKNQATDLIHQVKIELANKALEDKLEQEFLDLTLPSRSYSTGSIHPVSQTLDSMLAIFSSFGFDVKDGGSIEDDWHNFTALNIASNHPARQMHDTFYLQNTEADKKELLLRTHTSPVQIRSMINKTPPFRFVSYGRVYRCDSDATHTPMFHQIEGVYVDKEVNLGHLKFILSDFLSKFFEKDNIKIRMRPSFFPFTEPSIEVDIGCKRENGKITLGEGDDWLEVLGCGMIHPNVLKNVGINPDEYRGFAFGMGVDRFAMLKYGINDLREFFSADKRWINHYNFSAFDIPSILGGLTK